MNYCPVRQHNREESDSGPFRGVANPLSRKARVGSNPTSSAKFYICYNMSDEIPALQKTHFCE